MAIPNKIKMTASAFDDWVQLPENADKRLEFVAGEIIDVPSNPYVSKIAGLILTFINIYLFKNDIGHLTGEAGGYMVAGERAMLLMLPLSPMKNKLNSQRKATILIHQI